MAHYAFIDENYIVTEVIVGKDESNYDWEQHYGNLRGQLCKRTSFHGNIRTNYAGIGYTYDAIKDVYVPPQPFPSWTLNEATCWWTAPTLMPKDEKHYTWDETTLAWVELV